MLAGFVGTLAALWWIRRVRRARGKAKAAVRVHETVGTGSNFRP